MRRAECITQHSDLAVAGYRCFKAVMFLTGFIFGSIIVYLICLQEKLLPVYGNAGTVLPRPTN
jgi:hypothetical protein